jgi:hypothetical protein
MAIYPGNRDWLLKATSESLPPLPKELEVSAYPNPFNAETVIQFNLPVGGDLEFIIVDITCREVARGGLKAIPSGSERYHWKASNIPSGVYYIKAKLTGKANSFDRTIKLVHIN